ncbi:MAG: two-component regulator propeller domain-containing protein [Flavobacteriales bacterium]
MRCLALIFLLMFGANVRQATAQRAALRSFSDPRVVDRSAGLSSDNINDVLVDPEGALWVATTEGLDRFDGSHVRHFRHRATDSTSLPHNEVNRLALDRSGNLWVGTAKGLARMDRRTGTFRNYRARADDHLALTNDYVMSLLVDRRGRLWVGTYTGGLALYTPERDGFQRIEQPIAPNNYLDRQQRIPAMIVSDPEDNDRLWVATAGGLLELDARRQVTRLITVPPSGVDARLNDDRNTLRRILVCPQGELLLTTSGAGVHRYDPRTGAFHTYQLSTSVGASRTLNNLNDIVADADGTIYIGSGQGGLAVLDTLLGTMSLLDDRQRPDLLGIAGRGITGLSLWKDGTLIAITDRDLRLFNAQREVFLKLALPEGIGRSINPKQLGPMLPIGKKEVLVGGQGLDGLYRVDLSSGAYRLIAPPTPTGPGTREQFTAYDLVREDDGHVLVLADDGLYRADLQRDRMTAIATDLYERVEQRFFLSMARHPSGDLYVGTRHDGLFRLGPDHQVKEQFMHLDEVDDSLIASDLLRLVRIDPEGRVWVATERGLSMFDPRTGRFQNLDNRTRLDSAVQLIVIRDLEFEPDGGVWLVDHRLGMGRIVDRKARNWSLHSEPVPAVLRSGQVTSIRRDHEGALWIAGPEALVRRAADGTEQHFAHPHGLAQGSLERLELLPDGRIIGATGMLLSWQRKAPSPSAAGNLPVELNDLQIIGGVGPAVHAAGPLDAIELNYDERFFTIGMGAIDLIGVRTFKLEYELDPFNGSWTPAGPDDQAVLTNVPAGGYTFRVRAVAPDGAVLRSIAVPLVVHPPWWGTWWFRSAVALLVLALIYAFYRIRVNAIRKEAMLTTEYNTRLAEVELTALRAQMNPHFLFNSLNSIRHHLLNSDTEAADRYLSKFSRLIRLILDHSDQRVVPLADELQALRLYLELEAARFDDKFTFHISVDPSIGTDTAMIPPMLIQPYLENAVWHGLMQKEEGGSIDLRITREDPALRVVVEDDGIGRMRANELNSRSALKSRSRGMSITQQRMEMIARRQGTNCQVRVEDLILADGSPGGTRVTLFIPLH